MLKSQSWGAWGGTEAYQLKRRARCEAERKRMAGGAQDEAETPDDTSSAGRGTCGVPGTGRKRAS